MDKTVSDNSRPEGFGSIWNNNSWFYEEKNFTKFAKDWLTSEICKLSVTKDYILVKFYEMKSIEGDASVTIRK
jgi:activator of HSP90 ATPase